jgi:hypothetical protein
MLCENLSGLALESHHIFCMFPEAPVMFFALSTILKDSNSSSLSFHGSDEINPHTWGRSYP